MRFMIFSFSTSFRIGRFIGFSITLICLIQGLNNISFAQTSRENSGTITYGGNIDFFPFEYLDRDCVPRGFTIDLLNEIADLNKFKVHISLEPWNNVINSLRNNKRFNLTSLYFSNSRKSFLDFSNPLLLTYDDIFIRKADPSVRDLKHLFDKKVLVEKGGYISDYLRNNLSNIELIEVPTESRALEILSSGEYSAAIVNYYSGIANLKRFGLENITSQSIIISPREYGFAVLKGDSVFINQINQSLLMLKKNGAFDRIYNKWFIAGKTSDDYRIYLYILVIVISFLVLSITAVTIWNRSLKYQVNIKTKEIVDELTHRKMIERELISAREEAEKLSRLKSDFLTQISHEIRTPLNVILSANQFIKEEIGLKEDEFAMTAIQSVEKASMRLIRTIESILYYSYAKAGFINPRIEMVDLEKDVVLPIIKEISEEAKQKGIELIFQSSEPVSLIAADKEFLNQIFLHLIDNAVKFTDEGRVEITLGVSQNHVYLRVSDTGRGIDEAFQKSLFTPFMQEERGYTRSYEGNGLGLSLTSELCRLLQAEISVDSAHGKGSTFTVTFNKSIKPVNTEP